MIRSAVLLAVFATSAQAETPMTGEEFEAYVTGKSIRWATDLNPFYGVERYLPGRGVVWAPRPDFCVEGKWFERDDAICFSYDNDPGPECWHIFETDDGLKADLLTGTGGLTVFEADQITQPVCPGVDLLS